MKPQKMFKKHCRDCDVLFRPPTRYGRLCPKCKKKVFENNRRNTVKKVTPLKFSEGLNKV